MYADRYAPRPLDRRSLTLSTAIVGGLLAAAMLSNTVIHRDFADRDLPTYAVPPETPPPPPDPQPKKQPKTDPRVEQVVRHDPIVPTVVKPTDFTTTTIDPGPPPPLPGTGDGAGVTIDPPKPPPPVRRGADVDNRYLRDFQPTYPAEERRAGREGVVTLKVLIGVDGRVRQVERVAAASDAFWQVTERQALAKWRFKPATRDGVPYESWKQMTVRFRLEEEG